MSIGTAIEQLLEVEEQRKEGAYSGATLCVGVARLGAASQRVVAGSMAELADYDFGPPLHSLIIAGETHVVEDEMLAQFRTRPI
jgi:diphthine synthase